MLTVITINKNNKVGMQATKSSIELQKNQKFRWLIIDGNSTDGSLNDIGNRPDTVLSEGDTGIYNAMNKGLMLSKNSHVMFVNSGDVFYDEYVTDVIIMHSKQHSLLYGDILMHSKSYNRLWRSGKFRKFKLWLGWHPPHPAFIMFNKLDEKDCYFNENYKIAADYDLMVRKLLYSSACIKYLPHLLVKMELGGVSNSNIFNIFKANFECAVSWRSRIIMPAFWLIITKPIFKLLQFRQGH
jgi:glycosyltransferase